jgi:hypothetical protein
VIIEAQDLQKVWLVSLITSFSGNDAKRDQLIAPERAIFVPMAELTICFRLAGNKAIADLLEHVRLPCEKHFV